MKGYIFITSTGTDPLVGKHLKDPSLEGIPTFGACQPQIRKQLDPDDFVFVVSGSVRSVNQYVIGGLQVDKKIHATEAYRAMPDQRLHLLGDQQLSGNIICDENGARHKLDNHHSFEKRLPNYIVGKNSIVLESSAEVAEGRARTLEILRSIFHKEGKIPRDVIGRCSRMDADQVHELLYFLEGIKAH